MAISLLENTKRRAKIALEIVKKMLRHDFYILREYSTYALQNIYSNIGQILDSINLNEKGYSSTES